MTRAAPALSVIVAATGPLDGVPDCVRTLLQYPGPRELEIMLAYAAEGELLDERSEAYSRVIFIRVWKEASLPQLLGKAIPRARGEIVAVTDATCAIDARWVVATLAAHAASDPVVGGAVEPDGLNTLVDWAGYFCDYGAFMFPLRPGVVRHVPGINISFKRSALAKGRKFVAGEFWKAYWCQELKAEGFVLRIEPSMLVFYRKSFSLLPFLRLRFYHGRCFAGMRLTQLTRLQRVKFVLGSPLLPVVFCARFLKNMLPKRRYVRQLVLSFPIVTFAMISWALGEFCGYVAGAGASCGRVR
jgi:hypothetical protein